MVSDEILVRRIKQFRDLMNPNMNTTTLYHGLDDILNGKKPLFYEDNDIEFVDVKEANSN